MLSETVAIDKPTDINYVFGGYAPLSIRFIEKMFEMKGFKNMADGKP